MRKTKESKNYKVYGSSIAIYLLIVYLTYAVAIVAYHYDTTSLSNASVIMVFAFPFAAIASGWVAKKKPGSSAVLGTLSYFISVLMSAVLVANIVSEQKAIEVIGRNLAALPFLIAISWIFGLLGYKLKKLLQK